MRDWRHSLNRICFTVVLLCLVTVPFAAALGTGAQDLDRLGINQLLKAGSDVTMLHSMSFYLYFTDIGKAESAARALRKQGFEDLLVSSRRGKLWLVKVHHTMIPDHTRLSELRKRFEMICREHDGEYDGWETAPVKP